MQENNIEIFFHKVGTSTVQDYFYTSDSFKHASSRKYVGFIHCFTGCDTTSGFSGKGKHRTVKLIVQNKELASLADSFYEKDPDRELIATNGSKLISWLYGKKRNATLEDLRFEIYQTATIKSSFKLENLSPTSGRISSFKHGLVTK